MRAALPVAISLLLALSSTGCQSLSSDPGVGADLQIEGAQFVPGALPPAGDGPGVQQLFASTNVIRPGDRDQALHGTLDEGATGVVIGLSNDRGYWIVVPGVPDTEQPKLPTLDAKLAFAVAIAPGMRRLSASAVDARGQVGPPSSLDLTVADLPPVDGRLVISLSWSGASDLDLHVIDPTGVEIWAQRPNGYRRPPPPALPDPDAIKLAPQLDLDSNGQCVIDGRDRENVVYSQPPPAGHYLVRVDAFSLCGEISAAWRVEAFLDGARVAAAAGTAFDSDTRGAHAAGAGVTALDFVVPEGP
jgi:hypothetical protein